MDFGHYWIKYIRLHNIQSEIYSIIYRYRIDYKVRSIFHRELSNFAVWGERPIFVVCACAVYKIILTDKQYQKIAGRHQPEVAAAWRHLAYICSLLMHMRVERGR